MAEIIVISSDEDIEVKLQETRLKRKLPPTVERSSTKLSKRSKLENSISQEKKSEKNHNVIKNNKTVENKSEDIISITPIISKTCPPSCLPSPSSSNANKEQTSDGNISEVSTVIEDDSKNSTLATSNTTSCHNATDNDCGTISNNQTNYDSKKLENNNDLSNSQYCPNKDVKSNDNVDNDKNKKRKIDLIKVNLPHSTNSVNCSKSSDVTSDSSTETTSLNKPQLVVKKSVNVSEETVYLKFREVCLKKESTEFMQTVLAKLDKKFFKLNEEKQNTLSHLLLNKIDEISKKSSRVYLHIKVVSDTIKSYLRQMNKDEIKKEESEVVEQKKNEEEEYNSSENRKKRRILRRIDKVMRKCERRVQKLAEAEVDFDDEEDSTFIQWDKYKRKLNELWIQRCKYSGDPEDAGRKYTGLRKLTATGIAQVDRAITSFVFSNISKKQKLVKSGRLADVVIFPDYEDILKCVRLCNERDNLGLDKKAERRLAQDAFKKVGNELQRSRLEDYWDSFALYLEKAEEDPAISDPILAEKLKSNKILGQKKLKDVFEEYVSKQDGLSIEELANQINVNEEEEDEKESNESASDLEVINVSQVEESPNRQIEREHSISSVKTEIYISSPKTKNAEKTRKLVVALTDCLENKKPAENKNKSCGTSNNLKSDGNLEEKSVEEHSIKVDSTKVNSIQAITKTENRCTDVIDIDDTSTVSKKDDITKNKPTSGNVINITTEIIIDDSDNILVESVTDEIKENKVESKETNNLPAEPLIRVRSFAKYLSPNKIDENNSPETTTSIPRVLNNSKLSAPYQLKNVNTINHKVNARNLKQPLMSVVQIPGNCGKKTLAEQKVVILEKQQKTVIYSDDVEPLGTITVCNTNDKSNCVNTTQPVKVSNFEA